MNYEESTIHLKSCKYIFHFLLRIPNKTELKFQHDENKIKRVEGTSCLKN